MDSSIDLSISIICVPERYEMAKELFLKLGKPDKTKIYCDIRYKGSWFGTQQGWLQIRDFPSSTHHMTIEEDVSLCDNFYESILKAIQVHPADILSFYSLAGDSHCVDWAVRNNSHWYQKNGPPSGQCVVMPRSKVLSFLRFSDKYVKPQTKYEDSRMWGWEKMNNLTTFIAVPNLVNHIGNMISTLGFNSHGKVSPLFLGTDKDGTEIDWTQDFSSKKIFSAEISQNFIDGFTGKITYKD